MKLIALLSLLAIFGLRVTLCQNILSFLWEFLINNQIRSNLEALDNDVQLLRQYDFIVVGAGTAGCALAARLSENPTWKVLLLEAGGPELLIMDIPLAAHLFQLSRESNWAFRTQPSDKFCLAFKDNRCNYAKGKVMGGSSVLNFMLHTRANRRDFDAWAAMGNEGWSYQEVLPYFKKLEDSSVPDAEVSYKGSNGPIKVSYANWHSKIAKAFVKAAKEDGLPHVDYNGRHQIGVSFAQTNTWKGYRWSSNRGYLYPLKGQRSNLHIIKHALVTKILIDTVSGLAYGVLFETNGRSYEVKSRLEVILTAGAINTPQLLMLSGVGPAKHLKELSIQPIVNLPVGFNLQDHIAPGLNILCNETSAHLSTFYNVDHYLRLQTQNSILSVPGGSEAIAFYDLDNPIDPDGWPNMELYTILGAYSTSPAAPVVVGMKDDIFQALYEKVVKSDEVNLFMIYPMLLRPRSRGRILLASSNPRQQPLIYPNHFSDSYDLNMTVKGMQKIIQLLEKPAMRQINASLLKESIPACSNFGDITSNQYLECYARHFTFTAFHQTGTAKMGPKWDRSAVVDPRLRVHGIKGLRVADASIMPNIVSGHPNAAVYMIAEKAADMIKEDYSSKGMGAQN